MQAAKPSKPRSAVSAWTGLLGLSALLATAALLYLFPVLSPLEECFFLIVNMITVMAIFEIFVVKVHRRVETGLDWDRWVQNIRAMFTTCDFWVRLAGVGLSLLFFAFIWTVPLYEGEYYKPFFDMLRLYAEFIAVTGALYILLIHPALADRRDGFWHLGACVVPSLWRAVDRNALKNHALSLAVKAFFLPLMFVFFFNQWDYLRHISEWSGDFSSVFNVGSRLLFFTDVAFAVVGYLCTFRLLDAHIRRAEMRWGGWVVCLACYAPFNQVIFDQFLRYHDGLQWQGFLSDYPLIYALWGCALLALYGVYVTATVNFGFRFSNLTNRGVLTHGAYAYSKHPAYISKNISWWLESVPFLLFSASFLSGARHCMVLAIGAYIYYLRAKYEERTMAETGDEYRRYAAYINENGICAKMLKAWRGRFPGSN